VFWKKNWCSIKCFFLHRKKIGAKIIHCNFRCFFKKIKEENNRIWIFFASVAFSLKFCIKIKHIWYFFFVKTIIFKNKNRFLQHISTFLFFFYFFEKTPKKHSVKFFHRFFFLCTKKHFTLHRFFLKNNVLCLSKILRCKKKIFTPSLHSGIQTRSFFLHGKCKTHVFPIQKHIKTHVFLIHCLHLVYCVRCSVKNKPNTPHCNPWSHALEIFQQLWISH
jgi:hypothetical protein